MRRAHRSWCPAFLLVKLAPASSTAPTPDRDATRPVKKLRAAEDGSSLVTATATELPKDEEPDIVRASSSTNSHQQGDTPVQRRPPADETKRVAAHHKRTRSDETRTKATRDADVEGDPFSDKLFKINSPRITAAAVSPSGEEVALGLSNHTIAILEMEHSRVTRILRTDDKDVISLAFSPDGMKLVSSLPTPALSIWDFTPSSERAVTTFKTEETQDRIAWAPNGMVFATVAGERVSTSVMFWGTEPLRNLPRTDKRSGIVTSLLFSPGSERCVTATRTGTAHVWDARTAEAVCVLSGHAGAICTIAFSPDGGRLITGSVDGTCRVWNALNGNALMILCDGPGVQPVVWAATFSADGRRLHYIGNGGLIKTFDSYSADRLRVTDCGGKATRTWAFSADGGMLAASGEDHVITVWDVETGEELERLPGHKSLIGCMAFSRDKKILVSVSWEGGTVMKHELPKLLVSRPPRPGTLALRTGR